MTYPLRLHHDIARQTVCWLVGHRWVSSWRRVSRRARRGVHANPYWDFVSHWSFKCRRCRLRTAERYDPTWKRMWWTLRNAWGAYKTVLECYNHGSLQQRAVAVCVMGPASAFEQGWAQWAEGVMWPLDIASAVTRHTGDWLEKRGA